MEDRLLGRELVDTESEWSFFQFVRETIDPTRSPLSRKSFYDQGHWKPDWKAIRSRADRLEQRISLYHRRKAIGLDVIFNKADVRTPEGIYFAFPLKLDEWTCSFDTAGAFVDLDNDQLPGVSRDWVTVDKTVSVYDRAGGITLACPDAPLVQVGGFRFGLKSEAVSRDPSPLLLAWPMNNYWETNFRASQPGRIHLFYELSSFAKFNPLYSFAAGIAAERPVEIAAAVACPVEDEGSFLEIGGHGVAPLHVKPAEDGRGFIVRARNLSAEGSTMAITVPGRPIAAGYVVDTLENDMTGMQIVDGTLSLPLSAGGLAQVRAIPANSDLGAVPAFS